MALVKLGGGVAGISGSIGGTTFARNRFGSYARQRTNPVNPNTTRQSEVRALMANISQAWNQILTAAQRSAWDTYAAAVPWLNRIGETAYLTGFNMFVRTNMAAMSSGVAMITNSPTVLSQAEVPTVNLGTLSSLSQTISATLDPDQPYAEEDGAYLLAYQSKGSHASRNFYGGIMRYFAKGDGSSAAPLDEVTFTDLAYTLVSGQKTFVEFRVLRADGRLSGVVRTSGIAEEI